ncbi:TPA: hypothetical protein DEQ22_02720 [Candidatus Nomurabacteria bacterium]|uniref:Uncharacterized protein n=2 Tax=Candidatus Nomuraibacteriota TaxID=1752729 RepID=A0A1F6YP68_9BACT|nr:MAG: hypothetical protein UV13_C0002G0063 [Parcubacteria group bacterium GW2011_GWC1_42_21]KKS57675.1 MAG: hypothetical protein UV23_C0027G0009 [Candidatus Nomurabacteria bacterium GW2011_GWF1_42_40]KKS99835.1 MAG: hypothetical protein UV77_C0010G0021 [Candidatus Nomurabacteria bacterium GW2011_GWA1_43_17]KKT07496.1 MAG: hypothetical protein UV85_C0011G0021 [Candidatus Nomurabacteria bacterium GW2011_GWB1_43_19]KKT11303.1 MAG: hypothetical protein UV91_C0007G0003 [Candidatus Nomurabacteria b
MRLITWSFKRQIIYILILALIFSFFGFLIIYPLFSKEPTCADNKRNGDETGVDCGGSCVKVCPAQASDVSVIWARAFKVIPGHYNAVAYLVNHNKNAAVQKVNYRFRFADAKNIYIGKREGSTFIPPGGNFAVFEPGIGIGYSVPVYVTFEFTEAPEWWQVPQIKLDQLKILISNIQLSDESTFPRLSAAIRNTSLFTIPDMNVIVILYDSSGNAISTSRTYLTKLAPLQNADINFTWQEPLPGPVVAKEIIPMYDVFSAKLE